ncbi:MAG: hypothetical protein ACK550_17675 [Synechococcaceae cyanobacterium]
MTYTTSSASCWSSRGWHFATSLSGKSLRSEQHPLDLGVYAGAMGPTALGATPVREAALGPATAVREVAVRAMAVCEVVEGSDGPPIPGVPLSDLDTGDSRCRSIGPPACGWRRTGACTGFKEIQTSPIR